MGDYGWSMNSDKKHRNKLESGRVVNLENVDNGFFEFISFLPDTFLPSKNQGKRPTSKAE